MLPSPGAVSESHSEVEPGAPLCQRVALIVGESGTLVQNETIIVDDADLHCRIESVAESVSECEKRIDIVVWRKRLAVRVASKVAVNRRTGGNFENLIESRATTCMK